MSSESLTPEDWESMTESEREAFKQEQKSRLDSAIEDDVRQLEKQEQDALKALTEGVESGSDTHTVELTGGQEVEVIDSLPGELEKKAANAQNEGADAGIESMVEVMCHLIQTEGYDSPEVWQLFYEKYGSTKLMENAIAVTDPWYETNQELAKKREAVGNTRGRTGGN